MEKSSKWLNTYDIQRVLRQYEKSRPNFLFIGAVPIDFDYQPSPGNCIVNELCNINVENLLKRVKFILELFLIWINIMKVALTGLQCLRS